MSIGSKPFISLVESLLDIGDRQVRFDKGYHSVFIHYYNLSHGIGRAGGGAEFENNRVMIIVKGFGKEEDDLPPTGKVKFEVSVWALDRKLSPRGKSGTPEKIAEYVASVLNKISKEIPPHYTHTGR